MAVLFFIFVLGVFLKREDPASPFHKTNDAVVEEPVIDRFEFEWYVSKDLRVSFLFPKQAIIYIGCSYPYYPARMPIAVFESGNKIDIQQKYFLRYVSEQNKPSSCRWTPASSEDKVHSPVITVESVEDKKQVASWVSKQFGSQCRVDGIIATEDPSTFAVHIHHDPDPEGCFLNFAYGVRYSPTAKKIALLMFGQEATFHDGKGGAADFEILKSFRFEY